MQKHFKRLVSLLIVVFVISSVPIITSASSTVDSGSVNNSYQTRDLGKVNYSYTWEYHDDNTLVILPSSYNLYFNVNDLTDYMKTRFNSNTKITIDCSLGDELRLFGKDCPASNFTFIGPDLYSVDFYDFKSLNSINIDIDFAPSELPEIFNRVQVEIHRCGITTADIFEGEGYFVSLHIYDCNQITSLTAPEFVSYLYVFRCVNLESIQTTGKMSCFYVLLSENVKSIKVYGDITAEVSISNLPNLETFEFMGHVNYIRLNDIYIPDFTIRNNIGKYYIHCDSLTNVTFEPGITKINYEMFKDCINLSNVSIPFTVTEIHERAFANCSSLTSIVIPSDIDFICDDAFDGCDSLTDVYFPGNVELWESIDVRSGEDSDQPSDKSIYEIFGNATLHFPDPEIEKQPEDYAGPSGSAAEFTVKAEGSLLKYQWQVLKNGTWTNCSINDGARTDTLSLEIKSSRDGSKYQCVITDKHGNSIVSDEVTLTVDEALTILEQPADYSGSKGETATFTVAAQGEGLKYQWQVLKNGTWTNCSINDGAKTNKLSLEIKESRNGSKYRCVISDKNGASVTTDEVTLSMIASIEIITNPSDLYGQIGHIAVFTFEAKGEGLKYQWQVLKNGEWVNCSINDGARTKTLSIEIKQSRDGCKYRCIVTDKYGNTAESRTVTLTVERIVELPYVPIENLTTVSTMPEATAVEDVVENPELTENIEVAEIVETVSEVETETVTAVN